MAATYKLRERGTINPPILFGDFPHSFINFVPSSCQSPVNPKRNQDKKITYLFGIQCGKLNDAFCAKHSWATLRAKKMKK